MIGAGLSSCAAARPKRSGEAQAHHAPDAEAERRHPYHTIAGVDWHRARDAQRASARRRDHEHRHHRNGELDHRVAGR
jgi:hypothetical protein